MGESRVVDLLGLYRNDNDLPHVIFPVRRESCHRSLQSAIGGEIVRELVIPRGGHVPPQRSSYRVEAIYPQRLVEIAKEFGIEPEDTYHHLDTDPGHIISKLSKSGINIVEVNDVHYE